ncbi:glycine-rich cell wall structural protein 1.8 [Punica granatum]|uniref:Glycine-rich cell wall structural protein 1.8 n=1 Tax=Punica granatum TaxID=22663 RepID=A0A218VR52_PUNGR|nr:glycine-rich cell wall structural protein 1.8 [Punica granatum]OWM62789.1 hypothetical protein CDL15_Pgr020083 [Punica granatum]
MDRYQRVEKPKPESPINENEIRITTQGLIRNYVSYATTLLQEKHVREIVLKAMGQAISKTVAIAEIIKKRIPLHQDTAISSVSITDVWEPIEEGLVPVEMTRHVSMISVTLSTRDIDKDSPGYQAPVNVEQPKQQYYQQQQQQQPRQARAPYNSYNEESYGRGRGGRGRGRGRSWRGGYGNYQGGGNYEDGNYRGGNYEGVNYHGGNYEGGNYRGGNYEGGNYRGRNYEGGSYRGRNYEGGGGNYESGNYRGRNYEGGNYRGGNYQGGNYQGGNYQDTNYNGGYSNRGRGGGRGRGWGYGGAGYERGRGGGRGYGRGRGRMGGRSRGGGRGGDQA